MSRLILWRGVGCLTADRTTDCASLLRAAGVSEGSAGGHGAQFIHHNLNRRIAQFALVRHTPSLRGYFGNSLQCGIDRFLIQDDVCGVRCAGCEPGRWRYPEGRLIMA